MPDYEVLGEECFTDGLVISLRGENYYKSCDAWVYDHAEGSSYCVKRKGHPSSEHEAYDGTTRVRARALAPAGMTREQAERWLES